MSSMPRLSISLLNASMSGDCLCGTQLNQPLIESVCDSCQCTEDSSPFCFHVPLFKAKVSDLGSLKNLLVYDIYKKINSSPANRAQATTSPSMLVGDMESDLIATFFSFKESPHEKASYSNLCKTEPIIKCMPIIDSQDVTNHSILKPRRTTGGSLERGLLMSYITFAMDLSTINKLNGNGQGALN